MASIGIGALGEPTIAHLLEPLFGGALGHAVAVAISVVIAYAADHVLCRARSARSSRSCTRSSTPRGSRGGSRGRCRCFRILFHPFIVLLNASVELDAAAARHGPRRRARGRHPGRAQAADRPVADRRPDRRRRGEMLTGVFHLHEQEARQVMTPIPAVVTVDIRDRRGRAAPVRLDRALAAGRDRGRQPGPGQGDRPRQPARQGDDVARRRTRTSTRSCARRRSCPRPSRSTTCSPTSSASAPSSRS